MVGKYSEAYPMTGRLNGPLFKVSSGDYNRAKTHVKINIQNGEDQDRTLSTAYKHIAYGLEQALQNKCSMKVR